jgi:hypothetical protein
MNHAGFESRPLYARRLIGSGSFSRTSGGTLQLHGAENRGVTSYYTSFAPIPFRIKTRVA